MGTGDKVTSSDIQKRAMVEALTASLGIVSTACRVVDISRQTHYRWMGEDNDYKEAVEDISEMAIDTVESKLHELIKKGDTTATIFYLKTKAKKRGYIEKTEVDNHHSGGVNLFFDAAPDCDPIDPDGKSEG
jgi:hypothetical protein